LELELPMSISCAILRLDENVHEMFQYFDFVEMYLFETCIPPSIPTRKQQLNT
jgi:hypothetical protein